MLEFFETAPQRVLSNLLFYSIDGVVVVDQVIRYESLAEEVAKLAALLGLESPLELPKAKRRHPEGPTSLPGYPGTRGARSDCASLRPRNRIARLRVLSYRTNPPPDHSARRYGQKLVLHARACLLWIFQAGTPSAERKPDG